MGLQVFLPTVRQHSLGAGTLVSRHVGGPDWRIFGFRYVIWVEARLYGNCYHCWCQLKRRSAFMRPIQDGMQFWNIICWDPLFVGLQCSGECESGPSLRPWKFRTTISRHRYPFNWSIAKLRQPVNLEVRLSEWVHRGCWWRSLLPRFAYVLYVLTDSAAEGGPTCRLFIPEANFIPTVSVLVMTYTAQNSLVSGQAWSLSLFFSFLEPRRLKAPAPLINYI